MKNTDVQIELVQRFFAGTGNSYDHMVHVATLGIDRLWKRRIVDLIPRNAKRILDLACGTGISTLAIAARFPHSEIVGVELREEYLAVAREKIERLKIKNVSLVLSRAEDYLPNARFDCVTSSYLAKYADLGVLTRNTQQLLNPQGLMLMHDFTFPPNAMLAGVWRMYFKAMQSLCPTFFPAWREIYFGLPSVIENSRWLTELTSAANKNDFRDVTMEYLTVYGSAIITARKPRNGG